MFAPSKSASVFWSKPTKGQAYIPMPGDVLLFSTRSKAFANVAQSAVRFRASSHSHVALAVTQDFCIHSNPGRGVRLERTDSLVTSESTGSFKAYRLRSAFEQQLDLADTVISACSPYFENRYNYWFFVSSIFRYFNRRGSADDVFCSELVAQVYSRITPIIGGIDPTATLPSDLHRSVSSDWRNWQDVTHVYKTYADSGDDEFVMDTRNACVATDRNRLHFSLKTRRLRDERALKAAYASASKSLIYRWLVRSKGADADELYRDLRTNYMLIRAITGRTSSRRRRYQFLERRRFMLRRAANLRHRRAKEAFSRSTIGVFTFEAA